MASIWKQNRDVTNNVKRNNFDLSYQSHSTFKFGYLYPVFVKPVYPTDSFRIRSAFDLKMMPLAFPLQSRIRAHMHFFYVRNKNLWNGWEDYISGLKDNSSHPHPYISPSDSSVKTSSIYDYLNVPTSVIVPGSSDLKVPFRFPYIIPSSLKFRKSVNLGEYFDFRDTSDGTYNIACIPLTNFKNFVPLSINFTQDFVVRGLQPLFTRFSVSSPFTIAINFTVADDSGYKLVQYTTRTGLTDIPSVIDFVASDGLKEVIYSGKIVEVWFCLSVNTGQSWNYTEDFYNLLKYCYLLSSIPSGVAEYSDLGLRYYNNHQPLNALPFRAYESIYRAYYASDIWQPLVIDTEKEYNKFVTNDGDGLDRTDYHLFRRNYELDFLTSAMPSPQAGPAPMVGITALGEITITDANGVSTGQAEVDSSGIITKVSATSPIASIDHARTMMNFASAGFNINDLRSANALQRMAEQTLRSGFRYVNWVKGQFGRAPEYRELDMPEFIGGYSRDVVVNTVVSQSDTRIENDNTGKLLGDYGANGRVVGGQEHDITHYCDDYGWIIGIMCITPTPAYSQLLPKSMLSPLNNLSYANPFMNQIGMQPITYREVCPIQSFIDSMLDPSKSNDDTFGYQRPNYDLVSSVDEVHGEFRKSLHDYLIHRQFDGRPELGSSFLEIDPAEVNDVFINQAPNDDVFIGHLAFDVSAKRPLPRVHVPGIIG